MHTFFSALAVLLLITGSSLSNAEISVNDYLNRKVSLPSPARRVIALAPHIVENLYSAGAGELLVGAVDYCNYPPDAEKIPRVGSISSFSLEAIIEKQPDLIITFHSGRGENALNRLEKLGFTVYASNPKQLNDIAKSIRDFGVLTGRKTQAETSAKNFERQLEQLERQYASRAKVSTLYQVWNDPIQTLNDKHIISDVIRLCGGINAFGDAAAIAPKISIESVIARDPQVIIASGMGEEKPEWLDEWRRWDSLRAVKNNDLYFIPPDIIQRHTARILEGAKIMCEQLERSR